MSVVVSMAVTTKPKSTVEAIANMVMTCYVLSVSVTCEQQEPSSHTVKVGTAPTKHCQYRYNTRAESVRTGRSIV